MSLRLRLLPFHANSWLARSVITLEDDGRFFTLLNERLGGRDVPEEFTSFLSQDETVRAVKYPDDRVTHYGVTLEDDYGDPVKYVQVGTLLVFVERFGTEFTLKQNRAAWAYLRELEPTDNVALYWH